MPKARSDAWQPLDQLESRQLLATVTWDGGAGTLSWHDAANWSTNQLPGPGDDVVINVAGATPTITHAEETPTIVRSILNSEGLSLSGGTISVAQSFDQRGPMTMTGGVIDGAGDLILRGAMDWSEGIMKGVGRTIVTGSGEMDIPGTVFLARTILNDGVIRWQSGNIVFVTGAIVNRSNGEIVISGSGSAFAASGSGVWVNNGVLRREGPASSAATIGVEFFNAGDVHVAQGMLRLLGGGDSFTGDLTTGPLGTLRISGPTFHVHEPSSMGGDGTFSFQTGTHVLDGAFTNLGRLALQGVPATGLRVIVTGVDRTVETIRLSLGTLQIPDTLTVTSAMTWDSGTVRGPGRLRIGPAATLSLEGPGEKFLDRATLEVLGSASLTEGFLRVRSGTIENKGEFTVSGQRIQSSVGPPSSFQNSGVLRKVGPGPFQIMRLVNTATGTVDHRSGTLRVVGGGQSGGTIEVAQGALLRFSFAPFTIFSGTVTGDGHVRVEAPVTWLQGTINGDGLLVIMGEPAAGTLLLSGNGARVLSRDTVNFGTVSWTGGTLELAGDKLVNRGKLLVSAGGGLIGSGLGPAIENRGVITKFGPADASFASSAVQWNNLGIINVTGGTLSLDPARVSQVSGQTLTGGRWRVFGGGRLVLVGATIETNDAEVWLRGPGASFDALDTLRLNRGTLLIADGTQTFTPDGGVFTNSGRIILEDGADMRITGDAVLTEESRFETAVGIPTNIGRLTTTGSLTLGGTTVGRFTVNPSPGSEMQFMFGGSRTGEFEEVVTTGLASGLTAEIEYFPNGVRWIIS